MKQLSKGLASAWAIRHEGASVGTVLELALDFPSSVDLHMIQSDDDNGDSAE